MLNVNRERYVVSQIVFVLVFTFCFGAITLPHNLDFTYIILILKPDGTFQADVTCDLDAIALGVSPGADSYQVVKRLESLPKSEFDRRVDRAREYVSNRVAISFDGKAVRSLPLFPEYGHEFYAGASPIPTILGLTARFTGNIPKGVSELTVEVDRGFPPVYLTVMNQALDVTEHQVLARGAVSDPFPLGIHAERTKTSVALQYLYLGISHIIPKGLDHILFVLGLFLLSLTFKSLLLQITAFTVAHTLTLALTSMGIFRLPPDFVEPLIALSIAYVAIENIVTSELKPWRPVLVFLFGLLHGMGFAGVLGELGIPENHFLLALFSFNAGVEVGQLLVVTAAALAIGWFRNAPWFRSRITVPLSVAIGIMGLYWFWDRL